MGREICKGGWFLMHASGREKETMPKWRFFSASSENKIPP